MPTLTEALHANEATMRGLLRRHADLVDALFAAHDDPLEVARLRTERDDVRQQMLSITNQLLPLVDAGASLGDAGEE